jgi:hypothetical protein
MIKKEIIKKHLPGFSEFIILIIIGLMYWPLLVYLLLANILDYIILKNYYFKRQKWGLNICCGNTDGGGVNADIIKRSVPNFILIENIYKLPFKDKEFKDAICSHTMEHVDDPDRFYKELKRISENVVLLVPPIWDLASLGAFREHKWQFLTLRTKYFNNLPRKFKLPWWWYQKKFGQTIKG